jgi:hypothetical protein
MNRRRLKWALLLLGVLALFVSAPWCLPRSELRRAYDAVEIGMKRWQADEILGEAIRQDPHRAESFRQFFENERGWTHRVSYRTRQGLVCIDYNSDLVVVRKSFTDPLLLELGQWQSRIRRWLHL